MSNASKAESPNLASARPDLEDDEAIAESKSKARKFLGQMASANGQGSTLQGYNNELVKCIEDLREKREELNKLILKDEEDKAKVQKEIAILTDRLKKVNGKSFNPVDYFSEGLLRKSQARNEYDKTIQETEAAYMKILESSQTLLHVLKRETVTLTKKKQTSD